MNAVAFKSGLAIFKCGPAWPCRVNFFGGDSVAVLNLFLLPSFSDKRSSVQLKFKLFQMIPVAMQNFFGESCC